MSGKAYIGTSGFTYDHWKDVFYPDPGAPGLGVAAGRAREHLAAGRDVYAYFNNDARGLVRLVQTAPSAKRPDESTCLPSWRRPGRQE